MDDSEIINRLQNDDQFGLTMVLREVVPVLWPLLNRKFGDSLSNEDIEEVVATSLAKLWQHRRAFDFAKGDFRGWFYVILRNSALDLLRSRAPRVEEFLSVEPIPGSSGGSNQDNQRVFPEVIGTLSERERQVILPLFDRSGVSVADLSRSLSISSGAVRQLRFRALRKLEKGLSESGYAIKRVRTHVTEDHS